jgi:predicted aspartyl protease
MNGEKSYTSERFPYLPITVTVNKQTKSIEALLDTGFEGDLIIPEDFLTAGRPDSYLHFTLADPTATVLAPSYLGMVEIANLGDTGVSSAIISVLGAEAIIGRNLIRRFTITLDHGRRLRIEP